MTNGEGKWLRITLNGLVAVKLGEKELSSTLGHVQGIVMFTKLP